LYSFIFWTEVEWWVEPWFLTSLGFSHLTLSWQSLNNLHIVDCVIGCLTTKCFDSINNEVVNDNQQSCLTANIVLQNTIIECVRLWTAICVFGHLILIIFRQFKHCHFPYTKCRMKMTVFSFQNVSKSLYHYRQLQWTNTFFNF